MEDVMRIKSRPLSEADIASVKAVKEAGNAFVNALRENEYPGGQRQLALAITNAEQSVMWAVKGITG